MKLNILMLRSTGMEISISLSRLFVHEPLYQTTVVCLDYCTAFHVRVGITQACLIHISMLTVGIRCDINKQHSKHYIMMAK